MQFNLLVVDDSLEHQMIVAMLFAKEHSLTQVTTLAAASRELETKVFDLILLDVSLPDGNGVRFFEKLLEEKRSRGTPVIFITGSKDAPLEILGFNLGAEDFIVKPIEPSRLRARVEARLKQITHRQTHALIMSQGNLKVELLNQSVTLMEAGNETQINLTPVEFKLLFYFIRHPETVFSRDSLLTAVWPDSSNASHRTVDMHVSNLRKKITASEYQVQAVHGEGYRFAPSKTL